MAKAAAMHEWIVEQTAALGKIDEELARVQARLEFLESGASLPGWMHPN
jgi:hypothetical protein